MSAASHPSPLAPSGDSQDEGESALKAAVAEPSAASSLRLAATEEWDPRVLVVDDDPVCCVAAQRLLEQIGLSVDVAGDGPEAVRMSRQWPYVAIFMDCYMPDVDGFRATRKIRGLEGPAQSPIVIAVTSRPRHVCLASGMDHHIPKPLRLQALAADCAQLGLLPRAALPPTPGLALPDPSVALAPVLIARSGLSLTRTAELAASFVRRALRHLPRLWRAANSGDTASVERLAGDLGQHATSVGAARMAAVCETMAEAARQRRVQTVALLEPQVRTALAQTAAAARDELHPGPAAVQAPPPAPAPADPLPAEADAPIRVVIADDDVLARMAIEAMVTGGERLELAGSAADVDEVVELVDARHPDVVVLDYMMPGGGGPEAARRIRERSPGTRVVALTASDRPEAYLAMLRAGAAGLLVKGSSSERLTAMIRRAVESPGGPAA